MATWSTRLRGFAREALIVIVLLVAVGAWQTRNLLTAGEPAPPTVLRTLDGQPFDLATLRGQNVMVVFWATWCGVCDAQSGNVSRLHDGGRADHRVISVVMDSRDLDAVRAHVRDNGIDYPVVVGTSATRDAWRIEKYPTTYFLDPDGRIDARTVGYTSTLGMHARLWL